MDENIEWTGEQIKPGWEWGEGKIQNTEYKIQIILLFCILYFVFP
jgi:hypothetical protein